MAGFDIDDFSGSIPHAVQAAGGRYWAPYYKRVTINQIQTAHQSTICRACEMLSNAIDD
jgi:hypothetical protein